MKTTKIKRQLRQELSRVTPDVLGAILSRLDESEDDVRPWLVIQKKRRWPMVMAAAAMLVLCIGLGFFQSSRAVAARVSLDVNPGIEITVNRWNRVLEVIGRNEDGVTVIAGRNFQGANLTDTVSDLVDTMVQQGYISDGCSSVFISVSGNGGEEDLSSSLAQSVNEQLEADHILGEVLTQTVKKTDGLDRITAEYGVTEGKALFMKLITELYPDHSYEELSTWSVKELWNLIQGGSTDSWAPTYYVHPQLSGGAVKTLILDWAGIALEEVQDYEYRLEYWLANGEKYVLNTAYAEGLYQFSTTSSYRGSLYHIVSFTADGQWYGFEIEDFTGVVIEME